MATVRTRLVFCAAAAAALGWQPSVVVAQGGDEPTTGVQLHYSIESSVELGGDKSLRMDGPIEFAADTTVTALTVDPDKARWLVQGIARGRGKGADGTTAGLFLVVNTSKSEAPKVDFAFGPTIALGNLVELMFLPSRPDITRLDDPAAVKIPLPRIDYPLVSGFARQGDKIVVYSDPRDVRKGPFPIKLLELKGSVEPTKGLAAEKLELSVSGNMTAPTGASVSAKGLTKGKLQQKSNLTAAQASKLAASLDATISVLRDVQQLNPNKPSESKSGKDLVAKIEAILAQDPSGPFVDLLAPMVPKIKKIDSYMQASAQIAEGKAAPNFTAETIDGEKVQLSSLKGRLVLLDFWATWCGPCVAEVPAMKELFDKYRNDLTIIGVSADRDVDTLRGFIKEREMKWRQILELDDDSTTAVRSIYGVTKFPTTVLIDRAGTIRLVDGRGKALEEGVEALLKEGH